MDFKDYVLNKLKNYTREDIVIISHAEIQANFRQIDLEEVKDNLMNPKRLVLAVKQEAKHADEEKFDCLFEYGQNSAHRYIVVFNSKIVIVTIIKLNKRWQYLIDRHAKKI